MSSNFQYEALIKKGKGKGLGVCLYIVDGFRKQNNGGHQQLMGFMAMEVYKRGVLDERRDGGTFIEHG